MMENPLYRKNLREKAWETVKTLDDRRMAIEIQKLYYKIYKKDFNLVSVIIPTKDHHESFAECLLGAVNQDYCKYEIIVADSGDVAVEPIVNIMRRETSIPIKYIKFDSKDSYSLAQARNRAIIEADGKILVFCDDRMKMNPDALSIFANYYRPNTWLWGTKDGVVKGFVENFSSIGRMDFIKHGMFNERVQWYGGMTQEVRERYETLNGVSFTFLEEAKASVVKRSTSKSKRREDIIEAKYLVYKLYHK